MNRIDKIFLALKKEKKKAFIAYITAGDPSLAMTEKIVHALEASGTDIIELGIPFSDPVADGPTIQAASQRALKNGVNLKKIFAAVKNIRKKSDMPLVFMTYYNPVMQYGVKDFFKACRAYGVDGVIIPDLPPEEAAEVISGGRKNKVSTIFLAAPTSTCQRIKKIANISTGFIYYVSLTGVTGARSTLPTELKTKVRQIKSMTDKPVAVGFGISNASQAKDVAAAADAVIVGSALVKIVGEGRNVILRLSNLAASIARAIHNA